MMVVICSAVSETRAAQNLRSCHHHGFTTVVSIVQDNPHSLQDG
jgi:hypothetical protein